MTDFNEIQNLFSLQARAQSLIEIGRYREAIEQLNKALALAPDNPQALCSLSLAYHHLRDDKRAMEYAERAIQSDPEEEWAHRLRSLTFSRQGKKQPALDAAREAVRLAPEEPMALYALSHALAENQNFGEARITAEKLRALAPEAEIAHEALGNIALAESKWSDAEDHFRAALLINPGSYDAMNNLGVALLNQKRKGEATEMFHQAARLNPMGEVARENLKSSIMKFLPITGGALFLLIKGLGLGFFKVPFLFGWFGLQLTRVWWHFNSLYALLVTLPLIILSVGWLTMIGSSLLSLRSSRFGHLPENLQGYIRLERERALQTFWLQAAGGLGLLVAHWWLSLWWLYPQDGYEPQSLVGWLILLGSMIAAIACGVMFLKRRRR